MSRSRSLMAALFVLVLGTGACASGGGGPHKQAFNPSTLFSPVVRTGNLYFLSGVIARSQQGENGIEPETRRVLEGIRDRLATVGATMDDVVKCTVFLIDMADYTPMNQIYTSFFPQNPPARTAIAVQALPAGATVEIECIAAAR
jgi:2-iminobutanoate/2-iminopropanoate deaminase